LQAGRRPPAPSSKGALPLCTPQSRQPPRPRARVAACLAPGSGKRARSEPIPPGSQTRAVWTTKGVNGLDHERRERVRRTRKRVSATSAHARRRPEACSGMRADAGGQPLEGLRGRKSPTEGSPEGTGCGLFWAGARFWIANGAKGRESPRPAQGPRRAAGRAGRAGEWHASQVMRNGGGR